MLLSLTSSVAKPYASEYLYKEHSAVSVRLVRKNHYERPCVAHAFVGMGFPAILVLERLQSIGCTF